MTSRVISPTSTPRFFLIQLPPRRISTPRAYREKEIYIKAHKGWNGYARHCEHGLMAAVRRPSPRSIPCLSFGRTLTRGCASSRTGEGETARIPAETFVHPPIHPPSTALLLPDEWRGLARLVTSRLGLTSSPLRRHNPLQLLVAIRDVTNVRSAANFCSKRRAPFSMWNGMVKWIMDFRGCGDNCFFGHSGFLVIRVWMTKERD